MRQAAARCWAMLLARIYECLPLACPKCGQPICLIAFIMEPPVVEKILKHIGEATEPPTVLPARAPPQMDMDFDQVADGALYLVEDCFDPANTCVAGIDATLGNAQEILEYENTTDATQELFFVVDCYSGGGAYSGTASVGGTVATDGVDFDSIKAMYR